MDENDMELIHSYLEGSDAAFERLYNRYRRPLYGYLRSMLAPADADGVFQQTWVRACAALPGSRCRGKFQAWLFRIGRNLALDAIRRTARRRKIEAEDKTAADPPAARESEPWRPIDDAELCRRIDEALETLAPEQRAVFRMRNEALTFQVIADRQQCPVNTAVKRMRYAVGKLRKLLGEENGA